MTRKEVRDLMENELRCIQRAGTSSCDRDCGKCPLVREDTELIQAYGYVIKMLETDWTLVSEGIPHEEGKYLIIDKDNNMAIANFYYSIDGKSYYFGGMKIVEAWMPLPDTLIKD